MGYVVERVSVNPLNIAEQDYSIVKNSPEVVNSDTIEKGVEFWEYVFEAGKLNLIKEQIRD